jgi:LPS export ABC transporter protein LptC
MKPEALPPRLSSFDAPHQPRLAAVSKGYTAFVRVARLALPVLVLAVIGVVAAQLSFDQNQQARVTQLPEKTQTSAGQSEMVAARFESRDALGGKYVLTAESAARDAQNPDGVALIRPSGTMEFSDSLTFTAQATGGLFDARAQTLALGGGVLLSYGDGMKLETPAIDINIKDKAAAASGAVTITGAQTTINGQGLTTADQGNILTLGGPVRVTLTPKTDTEKAAP